MNKSNLKEGRGGKTSIRGRGGKSSLRGKSGKTSFRGRGGRSLHTKKVKSYNKLNSSFNDEKRKREKTINLDINLNATEYFTKNASFDQHYDAQETNRDKYIATLLAMNHFSVEIIPNGKARALAAAFARHDKEIIDYFLNKHGKFGFPDLLKSLTILDSKREKNAIEKKIERIAKSGSVMKPKKLGKLKNDLNNLEKLKPKAGSFSGAQARFIRKWVRKFTEKEFEYFALQMPTEPWKKLANLSHLNPTKDFPNAPWFLPFAFGKELPADSKVAKCKNINKENANELVEEFDLPWSFLKKYSQFLNDKSKEKIAINQEKLDSLIWDYEFLKCSALDDIIKNRLLKGDKLELEYGKLMERLLFFKDINNKKAETLTSLFDLIIPIAEKRLLSFKSTIPSPVAVLGDASSSMNVAIRTSTIISSLLATICSAKLTFFNHANFESELDPKNIADVLKVAYTTMATGSTSPASSLVPYFDKKEVIKTFIIVTDEEENTSAVTQDKREWRFFELFMEYRKNVFPAALIFVSFLGRQHSQGQMYSRFLREKVPDVLQFKFSRHRPDLTKLDSILGNLCSKSSETFSSYVEKIESDLKANGLVNIFNKIDI